MNFPSIINKIYFFILKQRYSLSIKGEELLQASGGMLVMPNHQAQIDSQIIGGVISQHCDFVPVVSERFLKMPVVGPFLRTMNAIAVSDLRLGNRDPLVLQRVHSEVMDALNRNKCVVIYPAGHITFSAVEKIDNKQSAYAIVSDLTEDVRIIGVRFSGLWGSIWSVAWTGEIPNFGLVFLKCIFYVVANFIFFLPKRKVTIEFVDISKEARLKALSDRRTFNTYLEDFYNINESEKVTYIKHLFYFPKLKKKFPDNLKSSPL